MVVAKVFEIPATYDKGNVNQDGLWKMIIGELFEDFLLFFTPDLHAQVDFSKGNDFLDKELHQGIIDKKKGAHNADKIVKVHLIGGEEKWVLVHIEVQGTNEKDFAKRMFQYFYRIYDRHDQEITAIAIMTSPHKNTQPKQFDYHFFGTELHYAYNNYAIEDYDDEELEQSDKIFSKIVLAIKHMNATRKDDEKRYICKEKLLRSVITDLGHSKVVLGIVFYFVDCIMRLPDELSKQLRNVIHPVLAKEGKEMVQYNSENPSPTFGEIIKLEREEGKEEGREELQEEIAMDLLQEGTAIELIAKITKLPLEKVKALQAKLN